MTPILADGINLSFLLALGIVVLVPLMTFEVLLEATVLRKLWQQEFRQLWRFTLVANMWSLGAGFPAKILNAWIYSHLWPTELSAFFANYPFAVAAGSTVYFVFTVLVEGGYAWFHYRALLPSRRIWAGILLANIATYAVLGPLHYLLTRPTHDVREFTSHCGQSIGGDWQHVYSHDSCGNSSVRVVPGLGSSLAIYRDQTAERPLRVSVDPGLLQLARFRLNDVAFLEGCDECLFETEGHLYLLEIAGRRVGTVAPGGRFILLTERYRKRLLP